ncbi:hypothetical protein H632_c3280p0 [Helicosporidium sp. ATCC 50920]|nr:hypothetical protein H632_c3280p0 [Helicosporidium sp. ATCC 50920]|eukprot:KDD72490.1 hypothetical protein H632_c3280p0 [Helicosporidium sp. ATCC 50920]
MSARIEREDQALLAGFFAGIAGLDGHGVAKAVLGLAAQAPAPGDARAFEEDVGRLFGDIDEEYLRLNTQAVVADLMDSIRRHNVRIRGVVSTIVVTTLVLEGWSTRLNPDIRILETLQDVLPSALSTRIGKRVDAVFDHQNLAIAAL